MMRRKTRVRVIADMSLHQPRLHNSGASGSSCLGHGRPPSMVSQKIGRERSRNFTPPETQIATCSSLIIVKNRANFSASSSAV